MPRRKALVYGVVSDSLVILLDDVAQAFAADHEQILRLTTFGDARKFVAQVGNVPPGLEPDDYDVLPDDEDPYDATSTNEYQNGDWPPDAATIALDYLPNDLNDIGSQRERFPESPVLSVDPAKEPDLVELLRQRGYDVRRDDELIRRI